MVALAMVGPWSGVRSVSPRTIRIRPSGTSSSSATILRQCGNLNASAEVNIALQAVMVPSSLWPKRNPPGRSVRPLLRTLSALPELAVLGNDNETISTPVALSRSRREGRDLFASKHHGHRRSPRTGGPSDRAQNLHMGAASAEIVCKFIADFLLRRVRRPVQQRCRGHDHAVDAIAACAACSS